MSKTTKDPIKLVKVALEAGSKTLAPYSHAKSPQKYRQEQVFAILVLRQFYRLDYRGIVAMLKDWTELREAIGIKKVPHYSTLCYAEDRILKKMHLQDFLVQHSIWPAKAA